MPVAAGAVGILSAMMERGWRSNNLRQFRLGLTHARSKPGARSILPPGRDISRKKAPNGIQSRADQLMFMHSPGILGMTIAIPISGSFFVVITGQLPPDQKTISLLRIRALAMAAGQTKSLKLPELAGRITELLREYPPSRIDSPAPRA